MEGFFFGVERWTTGEVSLTKMPLMRFKLVRMLSLNSPVLFLSVVRIMSF